MGLEQLQRRVVVPQRTVILLALCCIGMTAFCWTLQVPRTANAATPESLAVKRLTVVDDKGGERIVIERNGVILLLFLIEKATNVAAMRHPTARRRP